MPTTGYFVGPHDLNMALPVIPVDPSSGPILMVESVSKGNALPFHAQKLVFVLSSYRHFAAELMAQGYHVERVTARTYAEGLRKHQKALGLTRIELLEPREWGMRENLKAVQEELGLVFHDDGGEHCPFLVKRADFDEWAKNRKQYRMDQFYTWMRKRLGILIDPSGKPEGGQWSFDKENRAHARGVTPPEHPTFAPDELTQSVMEEVRAWSTGPGTVDGFNWPVTRQQALAAADQFFAARFAGYGTYQDAMLAGNAKLWHSLLSPCINAGLLLPMELVERALEAYDSGDAPLNAVEGFIRQVIGWREYIRGMYWHRMPGLRDANAYDAQRPLPDFFWTGEKTGMHCLDDAVGTVIHTGYAHHIQRLMVIGNFCLLAGIRPLEVSHWFWAAFVDAAEWVELPNVHGMALAADPTFTTKPYAASGAYINKMSDHCGQCKYNVKKRTGPDACPYNYLFWNFMAEHRPSLAKNPRMNMLLKNLDRWPKEELASIQSDTVTVLNTLKPPKTPYRIAQDDA